MILYSITDFNPSKPDDYFYLTHKNTTYAVVFFYTFVATLEMLESCVIGCFVPAWIVGYLGILAIDLGHIKAQFLKSAYY